ncbi:DUF4159 domain-containing protein [Candidatus Latescibacterota bacterium]
MPTEKNIPDEELRISHILDIKRLERENRQYLYLGFIVAVLFHGLLAVFVTYERVIVEVQEPRTIKVRLIDLPPSTPYHVRVPKLLRKYIYRRRFTRSIPEYRDNESAPPQPFDASLPEEEYFDIDIDYDYHNLHLAEILTDSLMIEDSLSRIPDETIPMSERLLTDTGRYMAEVLIDPLEKKAIQGYVHIALARGERFKPSENTRQVASDMVSLLNRYTNIAAAADDNVFRNNLYRYPFIVISADVPFELTGRENSSLRRYIRSGGLVIFENRAPLKGVDPVGAQVKKYLMDIFGPKFFSIRPLDPRHAIYHCFFDIDRNDLRLNEVHGDVDRNIMGIYNKRQLLALYCPQGFSGHWKGRERTPNHEIGVNLAVFALSQGRWFDSDRRLAVEDYSTGTFTRWYENGKMRFRVSEWLGVRRPEWIPSNRFVQRFMKDPVTKRTVFLHDDGIGEWLKNKKWYTFQVSSGPPMKLIHWGDYKVYESWHDNGQKMYHYDYSRRTFTEWDDFGMVVEQGGDSRNVN